jgi:hypothetical protein
MRPEAAAPLAAAAKRRHELTRAKAIQAIRELDRSGAAVTFTAVAGQAQVSRSWLYSQPDICQQIRQLRGTTGRSTTAPIPASQRASDTSLLRRWLVIHWDAWTRRHQARARWFHKRARLARDAEIALVS